MVVNLSTWITGTTRRGKTERLVQKFCQWVQNQEAKRPKSSSLPSLGILVFAANDDNRRELADRLSLAVQGRYPVLAKTPLGFISDEVILFWPLLFEKLNLKAQFPLRLRPETEQELATQLWRQAFQDKNFPQTGTSEYFFVRRTLDLLQLAAASGIPGEEIPRILEQGLPEQSWENSLLVNPFPLVEDDSLWDLMGKLLLEWRQWCLERGLLSYGIIYELYWRYLLPHPRYQYHLTRRYQGIFADDVQDYPAIARNLFDFLLDRDAVGFFTYNPQSTVRLGLNADPNYLADLASRCQIESLGLGIGGLELGVGVEKQVPPDSLPFTLIESVVELVTNPPNILEDFPPSIQSIQTPSRSALLRKTADLIIDAVQHQNIKPEEIVIIAPGLDEIARYTLIEILSHQNIPIEPLNEQRPLNSSPLIRTLLTLLAFIYPGLGRLIDRDSVAEMLVVLSSPPQPQTRGKFFEHSAIDMVRAGLLADYCYQVDPENPRLLPVETFPRWDRLGHRATKAYKEIREWSEQMRQLQVQEQFSHVMLFLDRAIKQFFPNCSQLPYDQLSALRELMETAQHYWEVNRRLRQNETMAQSVHPIQEFILLLRRGTITANPVPLRPLRSQKKGSVLLATIFQYRSLRHSHRWHFWLDAASPLWQMGGAANLFAYPLFLQEWSGKPWMPEEQVQADEQRLERILKDLLGRVTERVYLCHSDLAVNGSEQNGPLLNLVHAATSGDVALRAGGDRNYTKSGW